MEVKKRGQVTVFIILGIILLLAVILVIIFREQLTVFLPKGIIPTETSAVERFIETCGEQIANDGLAILGTQGGYIWLPPLIEKNPLAHVDLGFKVPFWQYGNENRIPSLQLMEAQLSRYMNENLKVCLNNLEAFQKQYDIVEKGAVNTEAKITEQLVSFDINYPIDIMSKDGRKITEIDKFKIDVNVKLKHAYEVAKAIMEAEAKEMKIEKTAVDLLALDPDIPLAGAELSCGQKVWVKAQIEDKVKKLLRFNIPRLRVDFTDYEDFGRDEKYEQNHYIWRATELEYNDIRVGLTFDEHIPFRMAVRPSSGQLLRSSELKGQELASFVCWQQWKFVYDMQFPVIVRAEDYENDYGLQFGFMAQVKNNRGNREQLTVEQPFFEPIDASEESYCGNRYGNYFMRVSTFDNVSDPLLGETHEPIDKVNVSFTCLKYTCDIGQTRYQSGGAAARLEAQFPYCVNGVLKTEKSGYKDAQQFVTTSSGKEVNAYLTPIKEISKYKVVKHVVLGENTIGGARALDPGEKAFISIRYVRNNTLVHETWGGYPSEADIAVQKIELLGLADFPYQLEVYLTDEEKGLLGGYVSNWKPDWIRLKDAKEIEFHVVSKQSFASDADRITFIAQLNELSKQVPAPIVK